MGPAAQAGGDGAARGGGRSHRPERREGEIAWLRERRVHTVVSTMATRHNLPAYEAAGLHWHHVPVPVTADGGDALDEILGLLRAELRPAGAVAVHGNRHTDFVAAVCAAHLHEHRGVEPAEGLRAAAAAGLDRHGRVVPAAGGGLRGRDPDELGQRAPPWPPAEARPRRPRRSPGR